MLRREKRAGYRKAKYDQQVTMTRPESMDRVNIPVGILRPFDH